ncbi:MAG: hypothetical protein IPO15_08525 [Anaerolineae bacterium]|uniref:hypothetical protein n=1 Tax=Candidatus Amarolinea dominans TaxID=3140696 RepID=UPI00313607B4|nr:hypothetical protein [Anaerolineae bacterium]
MAKKAGRTVGGVTYTLVYDAENRLQQVKQGSTVLASYTYDADGNRVKAVIGSSTTVYVGSLYEQTTTGSSTTITKYDQAGGQRIALRVNGVVRWRPIIWAARR